MSGTHSLLGASSAKRWLNCPGSIATGWPYVWDDDTSVYAAQGTLAHSLGEACLRDHREPSEFLDSQHEVDGFSFTVDHDMIAAVKTYVDFIRDHVLLKRAYTLELERKVDLSWVVQPPNFQWLHHGRLPATVDCELTGTADALLHRPFGRLCVYDYKHGHGLVEVEDNDQLRYYALAALGQVEQPRTIKQVEVGIIQPNAPHTKGPIRIAQMPTDKLIQWGNEVLVPGIKAAAKPNAVTRAGAWCHYCPASGKCKTEQLYRERLVESALGVSQALPEPQHLDAEAYARWLDIRQETLRMDKNYTKYATRLAKSGKPIPGHKLVYGRAQRSWGDDRQLVETLESLMEKWNIKTLEVFKPKTPKQIEDVLRDHGVPNEEIRPLLDLVVSNRRVQLVPDDDPREAVAPVEDNEKKAQQLLQEDNPNG